MKILLTNCCGVEVINPDIDICPSCGEHCAFEEVNEDEEADAKEKIPVGMSGILEETENLKKLINN